jgi:glycosyltransferase involved in cell wall biosynthesis
MKVLFVTGEFPPMQGGVGDYTRELGLALAGLGCQVHVLTSTAGGPVAGLSVYPVIASWNWGHWRRLLDIAGRHRPDVVHVQYQAAAYGMHPAINFLPWRLRTLGEERPRCAVTFHDLKVPYLFPKAVPVRRWVVNELARRSDAAITTNRADWEGLRRVLGSPPKLIPIGSNIAPRLPDGYDRATWRARWGAAPEDLLLCYFGFVNDRKGVDTLLHSLHLLTSMPPGWTRSILLMIGGRTGASDPTNRAYLAQTEALIARLGLVDRVLWTGSFLHGTFHAALAHGVPIISTQPRVDLPELEQGVNVFLVPPGQPEELAKAIRHLSANPELRETLGAGAETLSLQFRWDKIAAQTLELYQALGAGG